LVACAAVEPDPRGRWWGFERCDYRDGTAWCEARERAKYSRERLKL
jgi:hypothetical protein